MDGNTWDTQKRKIDEKSIRKVKFSIAKWMRKFWKRKNFVERPIKSS